MAVDSGPKGPLTHNLKLVILRAKKKRLLINFNNKPLRTDAAIYQSNIAHLGLSLRSTTYRYESKIPGNAI
jgi:hypothetical protein